MADQTPQLDINILLEHYRAEIAQLSGRAIHAEAEVIALRQANELQRQIIQASAGDAEAPAA